VGSAPQECGDLAAEVRAFLAEGLDGFFTDHPALGRAGRDAPAASPAPPATRPQKP
jgi:glycerophosphoryl diester phosphodiesterase